MSPTPERVFEALGAYQLSAAMKAAVEVELFTAIGEGNQDAASIAKRCGSSERGCRILCDFLTIHGFLTKTDGRWTLAPDTAVFLDGRSPAYLGGAVGFLLSPESRAMEGNLAPAVRKGGTVVATSVVPDNPLWVNFARNMAALMTAPAMDIAEILGDGGGAAWRVLDVAAGHGVFGIQLARQNPQAVVTALDWSAVLEVAKENAQRAGVADRYRTIAGNVFDTDLGMGYDLVLLTNILHHFDHSENVKLLRRVHAALKPGGRAVTLEFIPNDDRVTPPAAASFALTMLSMTDGGDAFTFNDLDAMFREAGFGASTLHELKRSPERVVITTR
jgi:SAM-dependent methyltransferase